MQRGLSSTMRTNQKKFCEGDCMVDHLGLSKTFDPNRECRFFILMVFRQGKKEVALEAERSFS